MQYEIKPIRIDVLRVNTENPRFEPVIDQEKAIKVMIENQGEKLARLAGDIVVNGLNPSDLCIVTPIERGTKFKVLEGNRRITALKLLKNNDLIPSEHESLLNRFKKLSHEYEKKPIENVSCVVFSDPSEANKWIKLKHTGENRGTGTVPWAAQEKARFEEKVNGKKSLALQVLDCLKADPNFDAELKRKLPSIQSSSLNRLLSNPKVREAIGFVNKKGLIYAKYPMSEIRKPLTKIIVDLSSNDFSVKDIYYKEDRLDYIGKFKNSELPDSSASISEWELATPTPPEGRRKLPDSSESISKWKLAASTPPEEKGKLKKPVKPLHPERNTIIPKDCVIRIESARINKIFEELKTLDLRKFVNAASITFRVFMEMSIKHFVNASSIEVVGNEKQSKKMQKVMTYFEKKELLTKEQLKPVRLAISDPNSIFSVNTFNAYVHNENLNPTASDLKIVWDNLAPFILKMWES